MKPVINLLILFIIHLSSRSQTRISTVGPCTDAMTMQAKGKWVKTETTSSSKEVNIIIDELHRMVMITYPQPTGVDAKWHRSGAGVSYFGSKRKLDPHPDGRPRYIATEITHFWKYGYVCGFFQYICDYNNKMSMYVTGETGTWVHITANDTQGAISGGTVDDSWLINGSPVQTKLPVLKTEGGHEFHVSQNGRTRHVLIHRKGILPYISVTRKQYLERCIIFHTKLWDELIKGAENLPVRSLEEQEKEKNAKLAKFEKDFGKDPKRLKSAVDYYLSGYKTDQQARDEQVQKVKRNKEQELKKFTDELAKTTQQGLLDSPAMIRVLYDSGIIFDPDPLTANMLVIENPNYIRKDLPKHVPQLFSVSWEWNEWAPQEKIGEIIEKNFPFEKLQTMIDK